MVRIVEIRYLRPNGEWAVMEMEARQRTAQILYPAVLAIAKGHAEKGNRMLSWGEMKHIAYQVAGLDDTVSDREFVETSVAFYAGHDSEVRPLQNPEIYNAQAQAN